MISPRSFGKPKTGQAALAPFPVASRAGALVPSRPQLDCAIGNGDPEGCPDGTLNEPDLAAMSAHKLGCDRKPKAGATGAVGALERLEQMRARLRREAGAGVGDLDHHHGALASPGDADLVAAGIGRRAAFERLHAVARNID